MDALEVIAPGPPLLAGVPGPPLPPSANGERSPSRLDWPEPWRQAQAASSPDRGQCLPVVPASPLQGSCDRFGSDMSPPPVQTQPSRGPTEWAYANGALQGPPGSGGGCGNGGGQMPGVLATPPPASPYGSARELVPNATAPATSSAAPPPWGALANPSASAESAGQEYQRWLASQGQVQAQAQAQADPTNSVEQKLNYFSRRTATELRRAERERGEHSRRLEALEELCRQRLGSLDVRFGQAREEAAADAESAAQKIRARLERDIKQMSEALVQHGMEVQAVQEQTADAIKVLTKRAEAGHEGLEELRKWRREAEKQLGACMEGFEDVASRGRVAATSSKAVEEVAERLEEQMEASLARERKQAHERLRSSCAELTAHLNELRRELVEQRRAVERMNEPRQREMRELNGMFTSRFQDLETQIAELGGALATRLQAKITSTVSALNERVDEAFSKLSEESLGHRQSIGTLEDRATALETSDNWMTSQVQLWRKENAGLHSGITGLPDIMKRETDRIMELARDEARTVHLEVMSVDTRLSALEERLADNPERRKYDSLLRVTEKR